MKSLAVIFLMGLFSIACQPAENHRRDNSALKDYIKTPKEQASKVGTALEEREQERRKQLGME